MGRYYNGDIEGKFWFGVQPSNDADFFGVKGSEPNYLEYYFSKDDLQDVEKGLAKCLEHLGDNKEKLDKFFAENNFYNDDMLIEAGFDKDKIEGLLSWYARFRLGEQIKNSITEYGQCDFQAEL